MIRNILHTDSRIALTLAVLTVFSIVTVSAGAVVASDYDLSVSGATDTPERTVSHGQSEFTIDGFADREPGQELPVSISTPAETDFSVHLYNSGEKIQATERGTGSEQVSFGTSSLEPGSYMLVLQANGDYVDVFPVVISGYDVSTEYDAEVEPGTSVDVTTFVTETAADGPPSSVEVAVWNEDTTERVVAQQESDGTYRATVSGLEEGSYNVYAVAQGDDQFRGEPEVLGLSSGTSLEVTESSGDDSEDSSDGSGGPDEADDGNESTEEPTEEDGTSTDTETPTETETADTDGTSTDEESAETETETEQNITMPNTDTETETVADTDSDSGSDSNSEDSLSLIAVQLVGLAALLLALGSRVTGRRSS